MRRRTSSEQVQFRMCRQHPEAVLFSPERLHGGALGEVPDANGLVFTAGHNELVLGVEERGGDVVEVTSARIYLPRLRLAHAPDLDLPVVCSGDDERKGRVERGPVDAAVVPLEHVLDGREVVEGVKGAGRGVGGVLAQTGDIPNAYSLILRSGYDEVLFRVELCRHDIVRVPSQDGNAVSRSAVPDADRLVVGRGKLRWRCCSA